MSILKIAQMGHPVLRQQCEKINPEENTEFAVQQLIRNMLETMIEYNGVGLAAPQVHNPVQLALVGGETDEEGKQILRVIINPEITVIGDEKFGMYEGCLSVPGLRGYVERPSHILVSAYDEKGDKYELELEGFPAVVMQHECDHLQGKLYIDRITDTTKLAFEDEAARFLPVDLTTDDEEGASD
jgi:peptide deformylase